MMRNQLRAPRSTVLVASIVALTMTISSVAQTRVTPPNNSFKPEQDVQLGQEAAAEVREQMPLLNDEDPLGVDDLVTHELPLDQAPYAYEIFQKKEDGCIKVILEP